MKLFYASVLVLMGSTSIASAQEVLMRRPLPTLPTGVDVPSGTPTPTPTPTPGTVTPTPTPGATPTPTPTPGATPTPTPTTPSGPVAYGWQPSCTNSSSTAACVRIGQNQDYVVPSSECPASQSAEAEAIAHARGLFGMADGVNAANASSVCGSSGPKSYFVGYGSCASNQDGSAGGYMNVNCLQAFVDGSGAVTARQFVDGGKCVGQQQDAGYAAFIAGPGKSLVEGASVVAPDSYYDTSGSSCTPDTQTSNKVETVTAGHCLDDGGYVCNSFDVTKGAGGKYTLLRTTPTGSTTCFGGNGSDEANAYITSLGYDVVKGYYSGLEARCIKYPAYGATSICTTTIVSKPAGGYDVNTGLKVTCMGIKPNEYNPQWPFAIEVPTSRCESAPEPTDEQRALISKATDNDNQPLLPYSEAIAKDCNLEVNKNYNLQGKILPGDYSVNRYEKTYEYPTAAMRAAKKPKVGDQYGEYTDMVYEGTFNITLVCTDIASGPKWVNTLGSSYWDGDYYRGQFYSQNHSYTIANKTACALQRENFLTGYQVAYYNQSILGSVGEKWALEAPCYEPDYGVPDIDKLTSTGDNTAQYRLNRCSPGRSRFFTWNGSQWVPGEYTPGNPQL